MMVDVRWRIRRCTVCWDSMLSICVYVTWQRFCAESHFHRNVLLPWWHCLHHLPLPETHISCGQRKPLACPHCSLLKCAGKDLTSWKVLPPTILSCCPSGFARNVWWRLPGHCRWIRWQGGGHMLNCEKCEPEQSEQSAWCCRKRSESSESSGSSGRTRKINRDTSVWWHHVLWHGRSLVNSTRVGARWCQELAAVGLLEDVSRWAESLKACCSTQRWEQENRTMKYNESLHLHYFTWLEFHMQRKTPSFIINAAMSMQSLFREATRQHAIFTSLEGRLYIEAFLRDSLPPLLLLWLVQRSSREKSCQLVSLYMYLVHVFCDLMRLYFNNFCSFMWFMYGILYTDVAHEVNAGMCEIDGFVGTGHYHWVAQRPRAGRSRLSFASAV